MTKMVAMPIYGKNPSKIFSGTGRPISKKLGVKHLWLKFYNVYINHDPVMTLTQFMGQNIDYSEKKEGNGPRASSAPALGLNTIIFKHVYWYMQQISGERLQDHWSSCLCVQSEKSCVHTQYASLSTSLCLHVK